MNAIAIELDRVLATLNTEAAQRVERAVRDTLTQALTQSPSMRSEPVDAIRNPFGYFEASQGSIANEPQDVAGDASQPRNCPSAAEIRAKYRSDRPAPNDATVKQWIDEYRMEKYGT